MNIAIVGYGPWGKLHAEKISANKSVNLVAVAETNQQMHAAIQARYPSVMVVPAITELPLIETDAVIIAAPASCHQEMVNFFLDNQIHVFCEKPLCSTLEEAQGIARYLDNRLVLQVGHSERFHSVWEVLRKDLAQATGPYTIKINRFSPFKNRATDVGVIHDLMIHDLDLIRFLFPDFSVQDVKAIGKKQKTEHFDYVQARLVFEDKSEACLTADRNNARTERSVEIECSTGTFFIDLQHSRYVKKLKDGNYPGGTVTERVFKKKDCLDSQQKAFFAAIRKEGANPVDYHEGFAAVQLAHRILEQLNN